MTNPTCLPGLLKIMTFGLKNGHSTHLLTRTVGVINLSQFLRATLTTLSWRITFHSSAKSVTSALDKSCNRDNFVFRRDLQKLRHGGLPAGTIFWLKYQDSYRRTAPPTFTPSTAGPLAKMCGGIKDIRLPALQVIKCIMTRYFFAVYQFVPRRSTCTF